MSRKRLGTLLRIAVTVLGLGFVLSQVDLDELGALLRGARPAWVLATFVLINLSLVVRALRWHYLLLGLDVHLPFSRLVSLYYVGNFFNSFLPTSFGGDVMRVVEVTRDVPGAVAAGTVIVDRLTGLLMLFLMALVAVPFRPPTFGGNLVWLVVGVSVVGLIGGFVLLEGNMLRRYGRWLPGPLSPIGDGAVARTLRAVNAVGPRALAMALLVSLAFNLILTAWWWTAGRALGLSIPFVFLLLVIPLLSISLLLPAIGGFGAREAVATVLFDGAVVAAGVAPLTSGTGFALSALVYLLQRASGLVGGLVYLWITVRGGKLDAGSREDPTGTAPTSPGNTGDSSAP